MPWYIPSFIPWYIPWGHNTQRTCAVTGGCAASESRRGGASESAYPSRVLGWGGADPDGDSDERPGRWARQGSATRRDAAATRMMRRLGCGGDSDAAVTRMTAAATWRPRPPESESLSLPPVLPARPRAPGPAVVSDTRDLSARRQPERAFTERAFTDVLTLMRSLMCSL